MSFEFTKENITTIATFLYVIVAPIMIKHFNFNINESTFVGVIGFIIAYISAAHPNTFSFLNNDSVTLEVLSDEDIIESNDYEVGDGDGC